MKLYANYSPVVARLRREGLAPLDGFKSHTDPEWLSWAVAEGPAYVHLPLSVGDPNMREADYALFDQMVDQTGTVWINSHMNAERAVFPSGKWEDVKEVWWPNIEFLANRYGAERVILENVVFRNDAHKWLRCSVEPENIREALEAFGVGLLLDTAHAQLSSIGLEVDPVAYLSQLPLALVRDLHVTGTGFHVDRWRDSMAMREEDWLLVRFVFDQMRAGLIPKPQFVTLEYGGVGPDFEWRSDADELAESLSELDRLMKAGQDSSSA